MRIAIVVASFLPFLYYAAKDNHFHFHGRKVSVTEHLLHLVIGLALLIVLSQAVIGNTSIMMAGLLLFLIAGALDEYVWHRDIPEVESDLHAKEHLALMIFVVVTLVVNWLESNHWQLPAELLKLVDRENPAGALTSGLPAPVDPRRAIAFPLFLVPYAYFGISDNLHHFRHRSVALTERTLHLAIVLAVVTVVSNAILDRQWVMLAGLVLFLIARSADEWLFHVELPGDEIDRHAKTHMAFLGFLLLVVSYDCFVV